MLVPYQALQGLPSETLENLIKEYLFAQIEDGSFGQLQDDALSHAINQCHQALKAGELVVEYSEDDDSIAIRHKNHLLSGS
jgi:uncharacterized protein